MNDAEPIPFSEIPDGAIFYPVGKPHRRLQKHLDGRCITNEKIEMLLPFRPDVPCVVVNEDDI